MDNKIKNKLSFINSKLPGVSNCIHIHSCVTLTCQFGQFGRPGKYFLGIFGFRGVTTFQKLKILGSGMILRENVKC